MESYIEGVKRVQAMLKPVEYPEEEKGYEKLPKLEAMSKAASEMNAKYYKSDINVT